MTLKAVLFDLDDTLVQIDTEGFTRRYLDQLATFVTGRLASIKPDQFKKAIIDATRAVTRNLDPAQYNSQVISSVVNTALGLTLAEMEPVTSEYFASSYQELREMATPMPGAQELIAALAESGLHLAIATNPLFVVTATHARVRWAGLDPGAPFALVTTADNMHFTKPHPHFYEEVLARLGVEAEDALMVGDNFENDILPALAIGMNAYWVRPNDGNDSQTSEIPTGVAVDTSHLAQGSLIDLRQRMADGWPSTLQPQSVTVEQAVKRLPPRMLGNVAALYGLTATLTQAQWYARPNTSEWSALELVCHLRDREREVYRPVIEQIAREDNPFIPPPLPAPAPGERDLTGETGEAAVQAFADERAQTLTFLSTLKAEAWLRPARHALFGPTTLIEMGQFAARHDRLHLGQLDETLAALLVNEGR